MANNYSFKLNGDGYWGAEQGRSVTISGFNIDYYLDDDYNQVPKDHPQAMIGHVTVDHDSTWDVYTDSAFVKAARQFTGITDLDFTEQGMQNDNRASMEVQMGYKILQPIPERYETREGLEGPFQTMANKVVYYDPKEGSYYDPDKDTYLTYDEWKDLG